MSPKYENVAVHGIAAAAYSWRLLGYLYCCEIPSTLIVATDSFQAPEFEDHIRQSERLVIVVSLDSSRLDRLDRKLVRRWLNATSPTTALVEDTGTILDLNGSDMEAFFQRPPKRKRRIIDENDPTSLDDSAEFSRVEVSDE